MAATTKARLTREQAIVEALGSRPGLYDQYERERLEGRYASREQRAACMPKTEEAEAAGYRKAGSCP